MLSGDKTKELMVEMAKTLDDLSERVETLESTVRKLRTDVETLKIDVGVGKKEQTTKSAEDKIGNLEKKLDEILEEIKKLKIGQPVPNPYQYPMMWRIICTDNQDDKKETKPSDGWYVVPANWKW